MSLGLVLNLACGIAAHRSRPMSRLDAEFVLGIARLHLETEASADVLPPMVTVGRFRWLDLPRVQACES
jgi:hypothetical protein